jgi:hypothetical protein
MYRSARYRGNKPLRCRQDIMHQSTLEARRCDELHLMQQGGLIQDLEAHPQPVFRLEINGVHICKYLADFRYVDAETGETVGEDVKGWRTETYNLKRRMMKAIHNIVVREVTRTTKS